MLQTNVIPRLENSLRDPVAIGTCGNRPETHGSLASGASVAWPARSVVPSAQDLLGWCMWYSERDALSPGLALPRRCPHHASFIAFLCGLFLS